MQEDEKPRSPRQFGIELRGYRFDQQRMLRHRENVRSAGLAVPARNAGEAVGDVLDLDVEWRGIEKIETASRQHPLPGPRRTRGRH